MGADIFRLACFAVAVSAAAMTVRAYKPELGQQAAIAAAALVLLYAVKSMGGVIETLRGLLNEYGVPSEFLSLLRKLTGIVYMAQFAADLCRDAGESAIAGRVELAGRIMVVTLCLPVIKSALDMIKGVIGGAR